MDKSEIKEKISHLVEKFDRLTASGQIKQYNEAQTRNEFIEPLLELLGWDMRDLENENEVTTEETVSQGRVDLAFRLNNIPVMFLEAKAAKVDLDEWKWAEQAINYSWNKGVTWAILTDFEGIKVFNAELPPQSVQYNLFFELKYSQYLANFDQLWFLSKESFSKNLLTEEAQKWGRVVQRKPVGKKLLESLTEWRDTLSSQFHAYNSSVSIFNLDEGVQKLLDRLIFIRTTEDRKIEQNILLTIKRNWESNGRKSDLFKELNVVFKEFRKTYDSKLFEHHDFETWDTPPAETLAKIIEELYKTNEGYRYDFSAIDSDVLGGIYEQYLGHVLQKAKKEFIVEEKHAKRKSQGIFYTPSYIVNFIVQETLGKILKEKSDNDIRNIKILDPACGSGSFLLKAYGELTRYYSANDKIFEKIRILKNNIYGVDLDSQAIEIARLNLLLQTVESKDLLPDLSSNIKNGNSLISGDENILKKYFGSKWHDKKPFDWDEEFPDVFKNGGFDLIIGNPPWGAGIDDDRKWLEEKYPNSSKSHKDTYKTFIDKSISLLNKDGILGFIIPSAFLYQPKDQDIRDIISKYSYTAINLGEKIFQNVEAPCTILIISKSKKSSSETFDLSSVDRATLPLNLSANKLDNNRNIRKDKILSIDKITLKLDDVFFLKDAGIQYHRSGIGLANKGGNDLYERIFDKGESKFNNNIPTWYGKLINRYQITENSDENFNLDYKNVLKNNESVSFTKEAFNFPNKIIWRQTAASIRATIDNKSRWFRNTIQCAYLKPEYKNKVNLLYSLAIFNSKLFAHLYKQIVMESGRVFPQVKITYLKKLQFIIGNKEQQESLSIKSKTILDLYKALEINEKNTEGWEKIKSEIEKTDKKIDQEVYKLYDLTPEEIATVEGKNEK